jgi:hypothetical protein
MELLYTPIQIVDQEGKWGAAVMMACANVVDGVVQTSSYSLSRSFICYDNCNGVGYIRQLSTEEKKIIRTGILEVTNEAAQSTVKYAQQPTRGFIY